jgi:hypothetical protein
LIWLLSGQIFELYQLHLKTYFLFIIFSSSLSLS